MGKSRDSSVGPQQTAPSTVSLGHICTHTSASKRHTELGTTWLSTGAQSPSYPPFQKQEGPFLKCPTAYRTPGIPWFCLAYKTH